MSSSIAFILLHGLVVAAALGSGMAALSRSWPALNASGAAAVAPPPPVAAPPPPPLVNQTLLTQVCDEACAGPDGACEQVAGVTHCTACVPSGYTIDANGQCADTSHCADYAWCTTTEATLANTLHKSLTNITTNYTVLYPYGTPATAVFVPQLGNNDAQVVDLFRLYQVARQQLGAGGSNPAAYWLQRTTELDDYLRAIPLVLQPYVFAVKSRLCSHTWLAQAGTCRPPVL